MFLFLYLKKAVLPLKANTVHACFFTIAFKCLIIEKILFETISNFILHKIKTNNFVGLTKTGF